MKRFSDKNIPTAPGITQFSTVDALMAGVYDGFATVGELKTAGDTAIGTLDKLDGEMIMVGGDVWCIHADGTVTNVPEEMTLPFATAVNFRCDRSFDLEKIPDMMSFLVEADKYLNPNFPAAVILRGSFKYLKARSVPPQKRPYPALQEITARQQTEFEFHNTSGVVAGFRFPAYSKGINVPGWHLHFIDSGCSAGGHVLGFELTGGKVELCEAAEWRIKLPAASADFRKTDLTVDRSAELRRAEQDSRGERDAKPRRSNATGSDASGMH